MQPPLAPAVGQRADNNGSPRPTTHLTTKQFEYVGAVLASSDGQRSRQRK